MDQISKKTEKEIERIERAAWFSRLAFGDFTNCQVPTPSRKEPSSNFTVMP